MVHTGHDAVLVKPAPTLPPASIATAAPPALSMCPSDACTALRFVGLAQDGHRLGAGDAVENLLAFAPRADQLFIAQHGMLLSGTLNLPLMFNA